MITKNNLPQITDEEVKKKLFNSFNKVKESYEESKTLKNLQILVCYGI